MTKFGTCENELDFFKY